MGLMIPKVLLTPTLINQALYPVGKLDVREGRLDC
jgi:hypothetical protein